MSTSTEALDERDAAIYRERFHALYRAPGPRVGDFVDFADGVTRRISFITPPEWLPECDSVQTSDDGSFYLGHGYASFSGALYPGVPHGSLEYTTEHRRGPAWFFHHDHHRASNGVDVDLDWRVFRCSLEAPR